MIFSMKLFIYKNHNLINNKNILNDKENTFCKKKKETKEYLIYSLRESNSIESKHLSR